MTNRGILYEHKLFSEQKPDKKLAVLYALKVIFLFIAFPILIITAFVVCAGVGKGAENYTFWPFVPAIIVLLFGIIFGVVTYFMSRKKNKKTFFHKLVAMLVTAIALTGVFGLIMDIIVPDIISYATITTLFVEDVYNNYDSQAETNKELFRQYVRATILSGSYDGEYSYEELSKKVDGKYQDEQIQAKYEAYSKDGFDIDAYISSMSSLDQELYNWIYKNYIILDYDYAFKVTAIKDKETKEITGFNTQSRKAFCLALTERCSELHSYLCSAGMRTSNLGALGVKGDERLSWLFNYNYSSNAQEGLNIYQDDGVFFYAVSNRITIPAVINLVLNEPFSMSQPVYDNDGNLVNYSYTIVNEKDIEETLEGYYLYLYRPTVTASIIANNSDIAYDTNGRSTKMYYFDEDYASTGVWAPSPETDKLYYVYQNGTENEGYVETYVAWSILDLLGDHLALINLDVQTLLEDNNIDTTLAYNLISKAGGNIIDDIVNEGLTDTIVYATDGNAMYLHLYLDDEGALQISLVPNILDKGFIGCEWMTWLQSNNLLLTVCGLMSMRNLLYFFGCFSCVAIVVVCVIDEYIDKRKQAIADEIKAKVNEPETQEQ